MSIKLETGKIYEVESINFIGWTEGDGTGHEGYIASDYFSVSGKYCGPDQHGIEPIFEMRRTTMSSARFHLMQTSDQFGGRYTGGPLSIAQASTIAELLPRLSRRTEIYDSVTGEGTGRGPNGEVIDLGDTSELYADHIS